MRPYLTQGRLRVDTGHAARCNCADLLHFAAQQMPPKNPIVEIELDVSMFKYAMDPASMVKFDHYPILPNITQ